MNASASMLAMESPNSYETLRQHCLLIGRFQPDTRQSIQQIISSMRDRYYDYPQSPLEGFLYPLARFADAHSAMDLENEVMRKRLLEVCSLRVDPPLIYMQGPAPALPDTRSYLRRVWDAVRSYR